MTHRSQRICNPKFEYLDPCKAQEGANALRAQNRVSTLTTERIGRAIQDQNASLLTEQCT